MQRNNEQIQFYSALGFYKEGKKVAEKINKKTGNESFEFISVATVSYSFSTELLLKLLVHLISEKKIKNEHRLEKLYNKLPLEYQSKIKKKYELKKQIKNENLKPIKLCFNAHIGNKENSKDENNITQLSITELLEIHSESFIKWRYLYEIKKDEYYYYEFNFKLMDDLINSIIEIINEEINKKTTANTV